MGAARELVERDLVGSPDVGQVLRQLVVERDRALLDLLEQHGRGHGVLDVAGAVVRVHGGRDPAIDSPRAPTMIGSPSRHAPMITGAEVLGLEDRVDDGPPPARCLIGVGNAEAGIRPVVLVGQPADAAGSDRRGRAAGRAGAPGRG